MSSNLTNVYAYLRKTFLDVDMMLSKPVSYVKTLVDAEKVIFIYKEVCFVVFAFEFKITIESFFRTARKSKVQR